MSDVTYGRVDWVGRMQYHHSNQKHLKSVRSCGEKWRRRMDGSRLADLRTRDEIDRELAMNSRFEEALKVVNPWECPFRDDRVSSRVFRDNFSTSLLTS